GSKALNQHTGKAYCLPREWLEKPEMRANLFASRSSPCHPIGKHFHGLSRAEGPKSTDRQQTLSASTSDGTGEISRLRSAPRRRLQNRKRRALRVGQHRQPGAPHTHGREMLGASQFLGLRGYTI